MTEVLPSHHRPRPMVPVSLSPVRFTDTYPGEVIGIIYPSDPHSLTKRLVEYRVVCQTFDNGTAGTIEFPHAILEDPFGGVADSLTYTLRADDKAGKQGKPGLGSKVLVRCVNGQRDSATIVGGYRDQRGEDPKKKDQGHHLDFEFNGVRVTIDDLGALRVERAGPTKADGTLDTDKVSDQTVGAFVELDEAGGLRMGTVRGEDEEQVLSLDHEASTLSVKTRKGLTVEVVEGPVEIRATGGTVTVETDKEVVVTSGKDITLDSPRVHLGGNAGEAGVLGDTLKRWLQDLIQALVKLTVTTAVGSSSPPLNAAEFLKLQAQLAQILSRTVKTE
jgi:phage baseplate assembly protein gpV